MGPTYSTFNNDTGGTQCGSITYDATATFHPTYSNEAIAVEDDEEVMKEIERLESMMHERSEHEGSMHVLQHRQIKQARCARVKHKKPHMNRKVMR